MGRRVSRRNVYWLAIGSLLSLAVAAFLMVGPPQLLAKSESAGFCAECHADEFAAWSHAGAHRRLKCVECHLPNDNPAEHYFWKSVDGVKDVSFFNLGLMSDRIAVTGHGIKVIQQNCIRCHEARVSVIDQGRQCWGCHRRLRHTLTGSMQAGSTFGGGEQAWK